MDPRVEKDSRADTDSILFEIRDSVAIITINRPQALNAMNGAVRADLFTAFERVERDAAIVAAILTGAGERAFCAGVDLKEAAEMQLAAPPKNFLPILGDTIDVTKPVIAAVNGLAFGGGLDSRANVRSVCGIEFGELCHYRSESRTWHAVGRSPHPYDSPAHHDGAATFG